MAPIIIFHPFVRRSLIKTPTKLQPQFQLSNVNVCILPTMHIASSRQSLPSSLAACLPASHAVHLGDLLLIKFTQLPPFIFPRDGFSGNFSKPQKYGHDTWSLHGSYLSCAETRTLSQQMRMIPGARSSRVVSMHKPELNYLPSSSAGNLNGYYTPFASSIISSTTVSFRCM